jgi:NAD(P)-dependent dehydrogenase (short-subunit alcohol dehydrogenase family)
MIDMNKIVSAAALGLGAAGLGLALWSARGRDRYSFRGRTVLITGGSRGLGLLMARQLADEGANLALLARDGKELERAVRELATRGADVLGFPCDVRSPDECRAAVARVVGHFGQLDVLINNAGVIQSGPLEHMEAADFADAMNTHFWGPFHLTMAAVPHMRRQGGGRVVNIASIGGLVAVPHLAPYSTSKFALVGFSDAIRAELAHNGIVVTTVCPGLLRTGSHYNALFKGKHRAEFAWFALVDSLPLVSIDAGRAAAQILAACRAGRPHLTISTQARLLGALDALAPNATAQALKLFSWLLPGPSSREGDIARTGWESQSVLAPSILTYLNDLATKQNNQAR